MPARETRHGWIPMLVIAMAQAFVRSNLPAAPGVSWGGMGKSLQAPLTTAGKAILVPLEIFPSSVSLFCMRDKLQDDRLAARVLSRLSSRTKSFAWR